MGDNSFVEALEQTLGEYYNCINLDPRKKEKMDRYGVPKNIIRRFPQFVFTAKVCRRLGVRRLDIQTSG
jgi:hypothetical protein